MEALLHFLIFGGLLQPARRFDAYSDLTLTHEDADTVEDRCTAPFSRATHEKEDAAAQERPAIGRFGRAHAAYLKRTQRPVYSQLVAESKLGTYLAQIDEQANNMLALLIRQMAEREGVTEQLKAADQMEWVRRMKNIRNRAEEIVHSELIYV